MALDRLAPDQRAVVQLVLAQERSYDDLADLLGISADAVRARAHAGLDRLVPGDDVAPDARGRIADYLLGQQGVSGREATRRLLAEDVAAREWAEDVSAELQPVAKSPLPEVPAGAAPAAPSETEPEAVGAEPAPQTEPAPQSEPSRPVRARPRPRPERAPSASPRRGRAAGGGADAADRKSMLGGALLLAGLALAIAAAVLFFVLRDDGDDAGTRTATASPTPTPTATVQPLGQIRLRAVGGGRQTGTMTIYATNERQIGFTIEATNVPQAREGEAYAVWLVGGDRPRRLGFAPPVGEDGRLGTSGPQESDAQRFLTWFGEAKTVVVARETSQDAREPGQVILRGAIPRGGGG